MSAPPAPAPNSSPARRRWRRRLVVSGAMLVAALLLRQGFVQVVTIPTPEFELAPPGPVQVETDEAGRARYSVGRSALLRRDGYWLYQHRGTAAEIGAHHGLLGGPLSQEAEATMFAELDYWVPGAIQPVLLAGVRWTFRDMWRRIPEHQLVELAAFSQHIADRYPGIPFYERAVHYHSMHDTMQALYGNPWVRQPELFGPNRLGGCTGFAASGAATADGHTIAARNFDFEVMPIFDRQKAVHLYAREGAIPLASVSWTGMAGVVSGLNLAGLFVAVHAARSEGTNRAGPPVSLLTRRVLEEASTLDEAIALIESEPTMVSDIYLVADGDTGRVAAIERGVVRFGVREEDELLVAANHLLSAPFEGDSGDAELRSYTSTEARHARMLELTEAARGELDAERAVSILRDQAGPGGRPLPPGHRAAIDALIATHSVVADATARILWTSTHPQTQGPFEPLDLIEEFAAMGVDVARWTAERDAAIAEAARRRGESARPGWRGPVPESPFTRSGGWARYRQQRLWFQQASGYLEQAELDKALDAVRRADALFPDNPQGLLLLARIHAARDDRAAERAALTRYMAALPDRSAEYHEAVERLEEL